jgi:hypothetical protein
MIGALIQTTPTPFSGDDLLGGDGLRNALDVLVAATGGEALFGAVAGALVILPMWIAGKRDPATPVVLLILLGGLGLSILPGGLQEIAMGILVTGIVSALLAVGRRYVLSPGAQ